MINSMYVNWLLIKPKILTIPQWNEKVKELNSMHLKKRTKNITKLINLCGTVRYIEGKNYLEAQVVTDNKYKYRCYFTLGNAANRELERLKLTGYKSYQFINSRFKRKYGMTLFSAFSGQEYKELFLAIKKCIPAPMNWVNPAAVGACISNVYIADESSSYPSKLSGALPTLHGFKKIPGRSEPDEDYPFAFYLNSGAMKIFNELEMPGAKVDEEITILCKKSEYSLKEIMQRIYKRRNEKPEYKAYMNLCIGYFQNNKYPFMSHISAVVLARCVKVMNDRLAYLDKEGLIPILCNTDSISWTGGPSSLTVTEKSLGAFVIQHENCQMAIKGVKSYQILDHNEVTTVFSGIKREISEKFKFGDIFTYEGSEEKIKVIDDDYTIRDLM